MSFLRLYLEAASYFEMFVRMYQSARRLRPVIMSLVFIQAYFVEIKRRYLIFPLWRIYDDNLFIEVLANITTANQTGKDRKEEKAWNMYTL